MDTEFVVHIHNGRLLNYKKNTSESALMRWMNLEPIIQMWSKSKRERQILYINACVWNLERWYWLTYLKGKNGYTDIGNSLVDTVWEGEFGMNWEISMETYALPYGKQIASRNLRYDKGSSTWCSVTAWRGGMGWEMGGRFKREGTFVCLWLIHVDVWQKPEQYGKAIMLQ